MVDEFKNYDHEEAQIPMNSSQTKMVIWKNTVEGISTVERLLPVNF